MAGQLDAAEGQAVTSTKSVESKFEVITVGAAAGTEFICPPTDETATLELKPAAIDEESASGPDKTVITVGEADIVV